MGDLNIFERSSSLTMKADFYLLEILTEKSISPNDLPALLEIPLKQFLTLEFNKEGELINLQKYIIKNPIFEKALPEKYTLMVPEKAKKFIRKIV